MAERSGKRRLEQAVNNLARQINRFADIFEAHGSELSSEELAKAFGYLGCVISSAREKASIARKHAEQVKGGFSLDAELPQVTIPEPSLKSILKAMPPIEEEEIDLIDDDELEEIDSRAETLTAQSDPERSNRPKRPVGRMVGTKEVVFSFDPPEKQKPQKPDPSEVPDAKHGGIADAGFIDD